MNLGERLAQHKPAGARCRLCIYLEGLTNEEYKEWREALDNPRFSHEQFVRLLKAEGVEGIHRYAMGNHRRGGCGGPNREPQ